MPSISSSLFQEKRLECAQATDIPEYSLGSRVSPGCYKREPEVRKKKRKKKKKKKEATLGLHSPTKTHRLTVRPLASEHKSPFTYSYPKAAKFPPSGSDAPTAHAVATQSESQESSEM